MKKLIILVALMLVSCSPNYRTVEKCDETVKKIQSTNITWRDTQWAEWVAVWGIYWCIWWAWFAAIWWPAGMVWWCVIWAMWLWAVWWALGATEESNLYIVNDTEWNQYSCEQDNCLDLQSNNWEVKDQKTLVKKVCHYETISY